MRTVPSSETSGRTIRCARRRAALRWVESLEPRRLLSAITSWSSRGPGGGGAFFSPSFSPFNANEIYTVSDMSGLYHSTNLGQSWSVADFRQIQGGIVSQVQFTSDPNILYTLDYTDTSDGSSSTAPSKSTDGGKTWKQVPGWNGANDGAFSLFADPQNTTNLLATDYGTLYFSNNGGQSFNAVYTDASGAGCYVGGVFWDGNNIYVGTDSALVTSSNGGATFAAISVGGLPAGSSILSFAGAKKNGVTKLACVTADSGDVFNGLEMGSISQSAAAGIWTLTPGNANWTKATTVPADDGPLIVSMALADTSDIYVGGTDYNNGIPIVAKSTNGGTTFSDMLNLTNNGNIATGWQGAGGDRQWSFDQLTEGFQVDPANANQIAFTGFGYLHLSTDGGATWRQAYVNPANQNPAGANTPKGNAYQGVGLEDTSTLYLNWANRQTIVAGYTDINGVRSTDGGQSWSFPTGITLAGNTVYCIVKQGTTLYAATSNTHDIYQSTHVSDASLNSGTGNVLYSTDNGATWQVFHTFGHPVVWIATDPNDPNRLYASVVNSTSGGIYTTANLSAGTNATWTKTTTPPRTQGHPFNIDVLNDGTVVATFSARRTTTFTDSSGVFISTDHGATWTDRTGTGMHWWTKDITIDPTDPTQNTWYASVRFAYGTTGASNTGGLYRTTNRGQTWTQIFQSIGAESAAINPTTGEMYLATEETGLWYSANPSAASPTFTQTTYPFRQPERIFFNPYNSNEVWVTSFGYGLAVGTNATAAVSATLTVSGGATTATPGKPITFSLIVKNDGANSVTGVNAADILPAGINSFSVTFSASDNGLGATGYTASGSGSINDTVTLPAGSSITYSISGNIFSSQTGNLTTTASASTPVGITNTEANVNGSTVTNRSSSTVTLAPEAELGVVMNGANPLHVGQADVYTIVVTNFQTLVAGSDAVGATISTDALAQFTGIHFSSSILYTPDNAATPTFTTASGTVANGAAFNDTFSLSSGSIIEFTLTGTVAASATGTIANTATVADRGIDVDASNNSSSVTASVATVMLGSVVGRSLFYGNSFWDMTTVSNPTFSKTPDTALAADKLALMPGQKARFNNYSSYTNGINGIFVDLTGDTGNIALSDFNFVIGNDNSPGLWSAAPTPSSISLYPGAGVNGSDRVQIKWADGAILDQWLQVTVLSAKADTKLLVPDAFYFGSAPGEAGNSVTDAFVNASDDIAARNDLHTTVSDLATLENPHDYNRDSKVNSTDEIFDRGNHTNSVNGIFLITPSTPGVFVSSAKAAPATNIASLKSSKPITNAIVLIRPTISSLVPSLGSVAASILNGDSSGGVQQSNTDPFELSDWSHAPRVWFSPHERWIS